MEHGPISWYSEKLWSLYHCEACQYLKNQSSSDNSAVWQKQTNHYWKNKSINHPFFPHSVCFPYLGTLRAALLQHQFTTTSFDSYVSVTPLERTRFSLQLWDFCHCFKWNILAYRKQQGFAHGLCLHWDECCSCLWHGAWLLVLSCPYLKNRYEQIHSQPSILCHGPLTDMSVAVFSFY